MSVKKLGSEAEFANALKDAGDKLVVVDFFATWCGPCRMISPKIEVMAKENTDVLFYKIDVDENEESAQAHGIDAMPTFLFFKKEAQVATVTGANEEKIRDEIKKNK